MLLTGAAMTGLAFLFFSCEKENVTPSTNAGNAESVTSKRPHLLASSITIDHLPGLVEDIYGNLNPNIADDAVIYNALSHVMIKDRKGDPVTYSDYMNVKGLVILGCSDNGTEASLKMVNLLPNSLYSMWVQIFKAPGYDGTLNNLIGYGRLSTQNTFKASHTGSGTLSVTMPTGPLSITGSLDNCLVNCGYEYHIVGVYQSDNNSCGAYPCLEGHYIEEFRFVLK
jgi:hypothetical protein